MEKAVLLLFAILLFSATLMAGSVNSATTEAAIYIRSDGSVEPSTAPIQRSGNVYTFTGDIYGSIIVERDGVVIDGSGFTLQGTEADDYRPSYEPPDISQGVFEYTVKPDPYVTPDSNNTGVYSCAEKLTIKNLKITEFWCGIELEYSSDNYIFENEITGNTQGIWIHQSSNDTFSSNNFLNNIDQVKVEGTLPNSPYGNSSNQTSVEYAVNSWDDGEEGNYWSDYESRYPNAQEFNGSGVWTTQYVIDENNIDHYPLMNPITLQPPELLPLIWIVAATAGAAIAGVMLIAYFAKSKRRRA